MSSARQGFSRRALFRTAAAGAAAVDAASYSQTIGANDAIRLGLIGCGQRGLEVMRGFLRNPKVTLTAVCDVFGDRIDEAREKIPQAKGYADHRRLLDLKDLDAVLIATPDHWHKEIAIDALNAGKDVYVEKPLTLSMDEGKPIVKAARLNNRVCQVGMQQRSGPHYIRAKKEWVDSGKLGKITMVRTWWHEPVALMRKAPPSMAQKPANLDWGRFLGQTKWVEWDPQRYCNYRVYLDYGGGLITDLFTHWVDVAHMFLNQDIPIAASANGGIYFFADGRTAPDTISVALEYPGGFIVTFDSTMALGAQGAGVEFYGTEGRLSITRLGYEIYPPGNPSGAPRPAGPLESVKARNDPTLDHVENFLECMRTRQRPNGDVLIGQRSAQACHLATLAQIQGKRIRFNPVDESILA